jgi:hypothetical protein
MAADSRFRELMFVSDNSDLRLFSIVCMMRRRREMAQAQAPKTESLG